VKEVLNFWVVSMVRDPSPPAVPSTSGVSYHQWVSEGGTKLSGGVQATNPDLSGVRTLMQVNHRRVIISATLLWAVLWFGETLTGVGAARINVGAEIITSTFCWLSASRPHRTTILITHRPQILEPFTILAPHPTTWAANSVGLQSYDKSWWSNMGVTD